MAYRFKQIGVRMKQIGPALPLITLPEQERFSPGLLQRKRWYRSEKWVKLRSRMLTKRDMRKCFFCGEDAVVLEHILGHNDENAPNVASILGFPTMAKTWQERFWNGPFVGSCRTCAASRSGAETAGRLEQWTRKWMNERDPADQRMLPTISSPADPPSRR